MINKIQNSKAKTQNLSKNFNGQMPWSKDYSQSGMVPPIILVAGVIVAAAVLVTIWVFMKPKTQTPPPSPSPRAFGNCADADYTGCDGVEVFSWEDDGKR